MKKLKIGDKIKVLTACVDEYCNPEGAYVDANSFEILEYKVESLPEFDEDGELIVGVHRDGEGSGAFPVKFVLSDENLELFERLSGAKKVRQLFKWSAAYQDPDLGIFDQMGKLNFSRWVVAANKKDAKKFLKLTDSDYCYRWKTSPYNGSRKEGTILRK